MEKLGQDWDGFGEIKGDPSPGSLGLHPGA
jgi:hypothetical protein